MNRCFIYPGDKLPREMNCEWVCLGCQRKHKERYLTGEILPAKIKCPFCGTVNITGRASWNYDFEPKHSLEDILYELEPPISRWRAFLIMANLEWLIPRRS
jgi:hypothetical protein